MCGLREALEDPKPWFYAGLFSLATAALPSMADDENVILWLDRVGDETRDLVLRLRAGLARAGSATA